MNRGIWNPSNICICAAITAVAACYFHPPAVPLFALVALVALLVQLSGFSG